MLFDRSSGLASLQIGNSCSRKKGGLMCRFVKLTAIVLCALSISVFTGCGNDKSAFVGRWIPEHGGKATRGFPDNMELFKDATGVVEGRTVEWNVENKRFILKSSLEGMAYNYEISEKKLTLVMDNGRTETYLKSKNNKSKNSESTNSENQIKRLP